MRWHSRSLSTNAPHPPVRKEGHSWSGQKVDLLLMQPLAVSIYGWTGNDLACRIRRVEGCAMPWKPVQLPVVVKTILQKRRIDPDPSRPLPAWDSHGAHAGPGSRGVHWPLVTIGFTETQELAWRSSSNTQEVFLGDAGWMEGSSSAGAEFHLDGLHFRLASRIKTARAARSSALAWISCCVLLGRARPELLMT